MWAPYKKRASPRACDRCHRIKERCLFSSQQSQVCDRCARLNHDCKTERQALRPGRPSSFRPHKILNTFAETARFEEVHHPKSQAEDEGNEEENDVQSASGDQAMSDLDDGAMSACVPFPSDTRLFPLTEQIAQFPNIRHAVSGQETRLIEFILDQNGFVKFYVFGASFRPEMQRVLATQFLCTPELVTMGYLGMGGTIANSMGLLLGRHDDETTLKNTGRALKTLLRLVVSTPEGIAAALNLGLTLITFNQSRIGHHTLDIARAALRLVAPWYLNRRLTDYVEMDPNFLCTLFSETFECLCHRQIPTFRYRVPVPDRVDRYYGISRSLLPVLYDICVFSHSLRFRRRPKRHQQDHSSYTTGQDLAEDDNVEGTRGGPDEENYQDGDCETWAHLLAAVDEFLWTHKLHEQFEQSAALSASEFIYMGLQAWCYQATARLILHQLGPSTAHSKCLRRAIAESILTKVQQIRQMELYGSRYILFAYFIAMTEMERSEVTDDDVLGQMVELTSGVARASCYSMKAFLDYFWSARGQDPQTLWLDLVSSGPKFSIGL
ncbi:hypothetical protein Z517_03546 [Fonsecaea pedrosoi CBS 271.37]|uniref:Zn(2)-C6 fungal-type domain-containing protein n=1 Tax=Fonsecaea pedrosoi CBS 271.37 TaxID=1442368 RepID=A0A0D2E2I6_9EURO|nr:uncharacterized protein Z517_03546 [Fonsecaea pedrosoi CBS 271.37]KIW84296.1 hypothetical protein Z517_03546 [Fonsecaea pedrosoi CBS 271.37]